MADVLIKPDKSRVQTDAEQPNTVVPENVKGRKSDKPKVAPDVAQAQAKVEVDTSEADKAAAEAFAQAEQDSTKNLEKVVGGHKKPKTKTKKK
jgi:hypothetical protein